MPPSHALEPVDKIILGCLAGDRDARELLITLAPKFHRMARRLAPHLDRMDLIEDVVQETFLLLLTRKPGDFDPARGSVWAYLWFAVRLAARDVWAASAPAGMAKRPRSGVPQDWRIPASVEQDAELLMNQPATYMADIADQVIADVSADVLLASVPPESPAWTGRALGLIAEGLTIMEAAEAIGVSRFTLRRAINRWVLPLAEPLNVIA